MGGRRKKTERNSSFPMKSEEKFVGVKTRQVAQREPNIEPNVDFVCVLASVVFRSGFGVRKYTSSLIILFSGINFPFSFFPLLFFRFASCRFSIVHDEIFYFGRSCIIQCETRSRRKKWCRVEPSDRVETV